MATAQRTEATLDVADLLHRVRSHEVYRRVCDEPSLRRLMQAHVFAVWDFQSLLKALQRAVTCVDVPWLPTADPESRRFLNEIVLEEESDECPWGGYLSHFELYHRAMVECGADTRQIDAFVHALRVGGSVDDALALASASEGVRRFVQTTMEIAHSGSPHRIAAAFSFGREEIVPQMFQRLVDRLSEVQPRRWSTLRHYLVRHIERDGEKHGPFARRLVARLVGVDPTRQQEAEDAARACLVARVQLWDEVFLSLERGETRTVAYASRK